MFSSPLARIRECRRALVRLCGAVFARRRPRARACARLGPLLEVLGGIVAQRLYGGPESTDSLLPHHRRSQRLRRAKRAW